MTDGLLLAAGIALLVGGGDLMVRGAAALARQLGVPPLVVGLTVVAFGTSAPELAVNLIAAVRGDTGLAFGNLIGSNLANVGLILAASALAAPLLVESIVITREIPMMMLASAATLVMGFDQLQGTGDGSLYQRGDGVLLLLLFTMFLYYTVADTLRRRGEDPFLQQARESRTGARLGSTGTSATLVFVGLAGLALGGHLTVGGAVGLAELFGVPKAVIGLTVVAVGTSLPELSASLLAARHGETELAVGNVVGSNIFNLLFVLGLTSIIDPVPVPPHGGHLDLVVMLASGGVLWLLSYGSRGLDRRDGALLIVAYLGYIAWRTL